MDSAIRHYLVLYCPTRSASILDIGCGNGNYAGQFADADVQGRYLGIDLQPHPDWGTARAEQNELYVRFKAVPAEQIGSAEKAFNFTFSLSALHFIPDDVGALKAVHDASIHGSTTVHCVPSLWSRFLYLRQGERRYSARSATAVITAAGYEVISVEKLGGIPSFLLHWLWISAIEQRIGFGARKRAFLRSIYRTLLRGCVKVDRWMPWMEAGYVVIGRVPKDGMSR